MNITINLPHQTKPQAPAGLPEVTISDLALSDGSGLPCGTLHMGEFEIHFECGYLEAPALIEDPEHLGSLSMTEFPHWHSFLAENFGVDEQATGEFSSYVDAVINHYTTRLQMVMDEAIAKAMAEILA